MATVEVIDSFETCCSGPDIYDFRIDDPIEKEEMDEVSKMRACDEDDEDDSEEDEDDWEEDDDLVDDDWEEDDEDD